jgi:uncharacterized iron-regulated membrane protein
MTDHSGRNAWQRWWHYPKRTLLHRVLFQIHLWSGIGLGLYVFFISITGSVLVYRNELYRAATPDTYISASPAARLDDTALRTAAAIAWPEYRVTRLNRPRDPDQAVEISFESDHEIMTRLFDPRTGEDVGRSVTLSYLLVGKLIELHDELLAGPTGRVVNGFGAVAVLLIALTGLILWWPGIARWQRALVISTGVGWKRLVWDLHSMLGFWSFAFILIFSLSGIYLCFPESFHAIADRLQPLTPENGGERFVDDLLYWLAFSHFGRINGIGLFCDGPGVCDQSVKFVWALFGLAPAAMFVTGAIMWWNRVLRRWLKNR